MPSEKDLPGAEASSDFTGPVETVRETSPAASPLSEVRSPVGI